MKTAFEGSRASIFFLAPEDIVVIGVDTTDGPEHVLYDHRIHEPLREATVLDMMKRGVVEPIAVRKDGESAVVIDGRRRVLHAREANRRLVALDSPPIKVPVLSPRKGTDNDHLELLVVLNEHREADSVINRARKMATMIGKGYSEAQVAGMFACSESTVRNTVSLLELVPEAQAALAADKLTMTEAYKLARKTKDQQSEALASKANGGGEAEPVAARKARPARKALIECATKQRESGGIRGNAFAMGILYALGESTEMPE